MISVYDLKPRFQEMLRPIVPHLAEAGVSANAVTVAALAISILTGGVLLAYPEPQLFALLPLCMCARMALNAVDGMLAREHGRETKLGAYLNELSDVVSDAALYLPFTQVAPFGWPGIGAVIFLSALSEMTGVMGQALGSGRRYDGPMGKSDRALVFGALGLWFFAIGSLPGWATWIMPLVAAAIAINIVNRVRSGLAPVQSLPHPAAALTPARAVQEHRFQTHDSAGLFYRYWPCTAPRRGCVLMLHRGHEHSGRMTHLADELNLPDFDFFAWDARGHGRSPGLRGDSPSFGTSVRDVQTFLDHITATYGIDADNVVVIAQSAGAVLAATWAHDYAPRIRAMVLAAPAFKIRLYVPFAVPALRLMRAVLGNFFVNSYVTPRFLTQDPERQATYGTDPLITRAISVNMLLGMSDTGERVVADAQAITIPTQVMISGNDWVVHRRPQEVFFERLNSPLKEKHVLDGFRHDTLGEAHRAEALDRVRNFIERTFACTPPRPDQRDADKAGATHDEAAALAAPLAVNSLRGLYWTAMRLSIRIGGYFSAGIKLGHETGFDSGSTLDYIYRNEANGNGAIGRLFDRFYLNSIGWRGIRQRKVHLEELIGSAMAAANSEGRAVHIVDIAAGHGRYVLMAVTSAATRPASILLRDYSDINVEQGRALIEAEGLDGCARFEKGDAFDQRSLAAITPRPNIGIVSGLYELFPENGLVRQSLAGLADAIEPGGFLIYTCQPWHPQLEMIARVLTSHRGGKAWVMRRRTQVEMDQLIEEAGFCKIEQRVDEWGIFTVSLARRRAQ
jgi:alpha-beta hydrolase superfamily lysophospholipase/phosphatidylglycerophosphate synthase